MVFEGQQVTGLSPEGDTRCGWNEKSSGLFVVFFKVKLNYDEPDEIKSLTNSHFYACGA